MEPEDLLKRVAQAETWAEEPDEPCLSEQVLTAFRAGSLDNHTLQVAEKHLSTCAFCTDRLVHLGVPLPQLSPKARATLYARLEQSSSPQHIRWSWLLRGGMVTACAALLLLLLTRNPPEEQPPLGPYQLFVQGGVQEVRGEPRTEPQTEPPTESNSAPVRLTPESLLTLQLLPERGVSPPTLQLGLYLDDGHGTLQQVGPPLIPTLDAQSGLLTAQGVVKTLLPERSGLLRLRVLLLPNTKPLPPVLEEGVLVGGLLLEQTLMIESAEP